jgi:hypothetical protein
MKFISDKLFLACCRRARKRQGELADRKSSDDSAHGGDQDAMPAGYYSPEGTVAHTGALDYRSAT